VLDPRLTYRGWFRDPPQPAVGSSHGDVAGGPRWRPTQAPVASFGHEAPTTTRQLRRKTILKTQIHHHRGNTLAAHLIVVAAMSIGLASVSAVPAWAAVSAQQQGAALLAQVQSGQASCGKLSAANLALMGEYDMGRIMGSATAQNAMNAQMLAIAGARGEQSAYRFMGERLGGCATGNGPVAFGTMMGMMGTSEMGASYGSAYPGGADSSSMMGRGYGSNQTAGNGGMGAGGIVAIVFGSLALLALIAFLATRRTPRRPTQPRAA
jgi:hypothetical protein